MAYGIVYAYGICLWYLPMVYAYGICLWHMPMVYGIAYAYGPLVQHRAYGIVHANQYRAYMPMGNNLLIPILAITVNASCDDLHESNEPDGIAAIACNPANQ